MLCSRRVLEGMKKFRVFTSKSILALAGVTAVLVAAVTLEVGATFCADPGLGVWAAAQVAASTMWWSPRWVQQQQRGGWDPPAPASRVAQVPEVASLAHVSDLRRPFVVRGALAGSRATSSWDAATLAGGSRADLVVDYFARQGYVPTHKDRLGDVVQLVAQGKAKLATESVVRTFPELLDDLPMRDITRAFGRYFDARRLGLTLTVPLFWARGVENGSMLTDLHCEPVASVALQIRGAKRWTLVDPAFSRRLRPAVSPDGRAYLQATLNDASGVVPERLQVTTEAGDLLFVPTFWWHRVDYIPGVEAMALSLFHFRPHEIVASWHNRLYFAVLLPNILKEVVGWKTQ